MDDTATSTDKPPSDSTTDTFVIRTPTNDMAVRGRNFALDFYHSILCVNRVRAKADSMPQRKCIISCRWQTVERTTRTTLWRFVRVAIRKLRLAVQTHIRIHTRSNTVGVFLSLGPFQLDNAVGSRTNFRGFKRSNRPLFF